MNIETNGGVLQTRMMGFLRNYGNVWYHEDAITNILSLSKVKQQYRVSFDSGTDDIFYVHKPKEKVLFECSVNGLYYHDTLNRNMTFVTTVDENMSRFSDRQVQRATQARELYAKIGCPWIKDFKALVKIP